MQQKSEKIPKVLCRQLIDEDQRITAAKGFKIKLVIRWLLLSVGETLCKP
jgi:hypothetical protein